MFGHSDNNNTNQINNDTSGVASQNPIANPTPTTNDGQQRDDSQRSTNNDVLNEIPAVPVVAAKPIPDNNIPTSPMMPKMDQQSVPNNDNHNNSDLLDLKQKALHELSPLVNHLDQTPEEKFRTTMMMIQASDDKTLLATAYQAAQAITDEKAKAQALLDVVNEINYFTQS